MEDMDEIGYSDEQYPFIGRGKELQNLEEKFLNTLLSDRPITQVIIITGEPMVGKTRLSKEIGDQLVRDVHQSYQHLDVYFIELRRVTDFSTVTITLSAALGIPPCSEYDIIQYFRRCKHHCLIIFDSADHLSVDISAELQTQFLDFCTSLVNDTKVLLLITSRFQYRLLSIIPKVYHHRLKSLCIDESVELLKSIAVDVDFTDETKENIADLCAGIPLALEIAATVLQDKSYTPCELVDLLQKDRLEALNSENYSQTEQVRLIIRSSVEKLRSILKRQYIKLAYIPSSFNAKAVAEILELPGGKPVIAKQNVLIPLTSRSLVAKAILNRFDIHDFLRVYLSDELCTLPMKQLLSLRNRYCLFYGKLLQALAPVVEEDSCKNLNLFTVEMVNIQKMLQEATLCPNEDYKLFLDIAYKAEYLIINFLPRKESVEFYAACVRAAEGRGPSMKKQLGLMLSGYGQILGHAQTNYKLADEQYERALDCLLPFGDSVDLAWLINHIGWNRYATGQFKQALKHFKDAERILKRIQSESGDKLPGRKRTMACVLSCLGLTNAAIGKPKLALKYHEQALNIRKQLWGNHPSIGSIYNNMSESYNAMGDHKTALENARLGLQIKMYYKREPSTDIIDSLINVASYTVNVEGDFETAHKHLDRATRMRKSLGGKHIDIADTLHCRGLVNKRQGNYSEAKSNFEKAYGIRCELGSPANICDSLFHLADVEMIQENLSQALGHFLDCLELGKRTTHLNDELLNEVLEKLRDIYLLQGNKLLADEMQQQITTLV